MSPRILIPLAFALILPLTSSAKIISKEHYKYPILDPDEATVASTGIYSPDFVTEKIEVNIKDRKLQGYRDHRKLEVRFYKSPYETNHLVFLISGIGGDYKSGYSRFLAHATAMRGADVVVVPNVMTEHFVISSSTTGLVGGSAADAEDLYHGMAAIKKELNLQGRTYSRVSLVGYSHGALVAGFLEASDQRAKLANDAECVSFDSALLINPPNDLLYAIRSIDARTKAAGEIGFKRLIKIAFRFRKLLGRYTSVPTTVENHVEFSQRLKLRPEERYSLIGKALTISLPDAILATQAVEDLGIFPELSPEGSVARRYEERERRRMAGSYNYEDYVTKFFSLFAIKKKTGAFSIDYLNRVNSLHALAEAMKTSKSIFLMHNMDDLLLTSGEAYWLDSLLGERSIIYPTGGHLGNMWYPDNLDSYHRWLHYGRF